LSNVWAFFARKHASSPLIARVIFPHPLFLGVIDALKRHETAMLQRIMEVASSLLNKFQIELTLQNKTLQWTLLSTINKQSL